MVQEFITSFVQAAQQAGIGHLDFYVEETSGRSLNVYQGQLEKLTLSQEALVYIQGEYQGCCGYTYVEDLSPSLFDEHIDNIKQTAQVAQVPFAPQSLTQAQGKAAEPALRSIDELTQSLKEAEAAAGADPRVAHVRSCSYGDKTIRVTLQNSQGVRMVDERFYASGNVGIVAREGDNVQTAGSHRLSSNSGEIDLLAVGREAADRALSMFGAQPLETKSYPVILRGGVVCDMIAAFLPAFYADNVQRKMSLLAGKLDQAIACERVTLREDPELEGGVMTRRFDDEGSPTTAKAVIERGVLRSFFHNRKTAEEAGTASTGNGFKASYKEKAAIGATNLLLEGGQRTLEQMAQDMGEGVIINECDGMFAGANALSGGFSLISKGYYVQGGEVVRPVNQITIAGNFFDMLGDVVELGCDYATTGPGSTFVKAPSVWVKSLAISGK